MSVPAVPGMEIVLALNGMVPAKPLGRRNPMSPQHHNEDVDGVSATSAQPAVNKSVQRRTTCTFYLVTCETAYAESVDSLFERLSSGQGENRRRRPRYLGIYGGVTQGTRAKLVAPTHELVLQTDSN